MTIPANDVFDKHESSTTYFTAQWADDLRPGETLSSTTWSVGAGLTKVTESLSGTISTIWVSGGTAGAAYELECTATYDSGRTEIWKITINVVT